MKNWITQYAAGVATNLGSWYLRVSWAGLPKIDSLITSSYFGHTSVLRHIVMRSSQEIPVIPADSESASAGNKFMGDQDQAGLIAVLMGTWTVSESSKNLQDYSIYEWFRIDV